MDIGDVIVLPDAGDEAEYNVCARAIYPEQDTVILIVTPRVATTSAEVAS